MRCSIRSSQYFDEDYDSEVNQSTTEVFCVISRSRIIVNIPSVSNLIQMYIMLMKFLADGPKNFNELQLEEKKKIKNAIQRTTLSPNYINCSQEFKELSIKILRNFARATGKVTCLEVEWYLEKCHELLTDHLKMGSQSKEALNVEAAVKEKEPASPGHHDSSASHSRQFSDKLSLSSPFSTEVLVHHDLDARSTTSERLKEKPDKRFQAAAKKDKKNLYFIKETFFKSVMDIKVKLKNMEMWIIDYNDEPEDRANILQLKFMAEYFYDYSQFGKDMTCSRVSPVQNRQLHNFFHAEKQSESSSHSRQLVDEENQVVIRTTLESNDDTQINLMQLSIEQLIVQQWNDVAKVVVALFQNQYSKERQGEQFLQQ